MGNWEAKERVSSSQLRILKTQANEDDLLRDIKTPKTWYLSSDAIFSFIGYSDLEDFVEHKYIDIAQVRQEYPYVVHVFKNAPMPPEIHKELSLALDDFGDVPLIVRSSSFLEDQVGMSFAGKYKSLFIANRGSKPERLEALSGRNQGGLCLYVQPGSYRIPTRARFD